MRQIKKSMLLCMDFFYAKKSKSLYDKEERRGGSLMLLLDEKKIFFTLMNVENNRKLLERLVTYQVPFTTEFVVTLATEDGIRVTKRMLQEGNLDKQRLYEAALKNAESEATISCERILSPLNTNYAEEVLEDFSRHSTKLVRIFGRKSGAAMILSHKILQHIEKKVGDFSIIPNDQDSITICLSKDKQMLNACLRDMNAQDKEVKISDYCFSYKNGEIRQMQ